MVSREQTNEAIPSTVVEQPDYTSSRREACISNTNYPSRREKLELINKTYNIPNFKVANIQSLTSKKARNQKIPFLREQCQVEKTYFLAFVEIHLKDETKDAEFNITGYAHETSNRSNRDGGGVIVYINEQLTYKTLISQSDNMCSMVSVYINELNLLVFTVYRPPPNCKKGYHGKTLDNSFKVLLLIISTK